MDLKYAFGEDAVSLAYYLYALDERTFPADAMSEDEWKRALSGKWSCVVYTPEWTAAAAMVCASTVAYLYSNAVVPESRRQGIGLKLIHERVHIARSIGCKMVQAHTRAENEQSQRLLRKCGFIATRYVPDFYDDFQDGIEWEMTL